jgi:hypothetical protein
MVEIQQVIFNDVVRYWKGVTVLRLDYVWLLTGKIPKKPTDLEIAQPHHSTLVVYIQLKRAIGRIQVTIVMNMTVIGHKIREAIRKSPLLLTNLRK